MPPPRIKFLVFILFPIIVLQTVGYWNCKYVVPHALCAEDHINIELNHLNYWWKSYNFCEILE
jgi:hypothetical protein